MFRNLAVTGGNAVAAEALALVIAAKMLAFAVFRVNNRVWRYTSSRDLLALAQASSVGSALALLAVASIARLPEDFGALFLLDWILLTTLLAASRLFLRLLAELLRPAPAGALRVLITVAGDGGVALLQEVRNNLALGRAAVGFVDDDPLKQRTRVQGLAVLGGFEAFEGALGSLRIDEVIVATTKLTPERIDAIKAACSAANVRLSRFRLSIESFSSLAQVRQIR